MTALPAEYLRRIADLHAELGIPRDYARTRGLPIQPEATGLVVIGANPDGRKVQLTREAAAAWRKLHGGARADGIILLAISGFRSVERQEEIIREKLAAGKAIGEILRLVAAPGHSEHHTGRALDLGTPAQTTLEERFATTTAFAWLQSRAGRLGFRLSYPAGNPSGFDYEPWHWCWHPPVAD
jgi:D-alanyl-D-alanine carboxypeptidase